MPLFLMAAFLVTAALYASVGFGGGSTYNALLVMSGADYRVLPSIALLCNIVVVSGGVWRFRQTGDLTVRRMLPFLVTSVPAAWVGGRLPISETLFVGLLGGALLVSGLYMAFQRRHQPGDPVQSLPQDTRPVLCGMIGGGVGLVSGLVGIGGGIFLAPVLYILRWGSPRQIAAACSLFILFNSLSGLAGQAAKLQDLALLSLVIPYWPLPIAVLIGGQMGSWLAGTRLSPRLIKTMTALLILYVAVRLLHRWAGLMEIF